MELGRSRRTIDHAAAGARTDLRGHRQQAASKDHRYRGRVPPLYPLTRAHEVDSATRWGRHLAAVADSIFAQFGSGPRRSLRRSAERPARAAWAALRLLADGRHRGDDGARALAAIGAGELRGHRQQAALKDQRFRGAATWPPSPIPFSLNSVRGRGDRCVGRRSDPLGPPGRRCGCWPTSPSGRRWSSGARGDRRRRATGSSPTGGIERPAV